jgi:hypothetical protein
MTFPRSTSVFLLIRINLPLPPSVIARDLVTNLLSAKNQSVLALRHMDFLPHWQLRVATQKAERLFIFLRELSALQ